MISLDVIAAVCGIAMAVGMGMAGGNLMADVRTEGFTGAGVNVFLLTPFRRSAGTHLPRAQARVRVS